MSHSIYLFIFMLGNLVISITQVKKEKKESKENVIFPTFKNDVTGDYAMCRKNVIIVPSSRFK